jgi:hypothetical protein
VRQLSPVGPTYAREKKEATREVPEIPRRPT